jgi:hypothetical protein
VREDRADADGLDSRGPGGFLLGLDALGGGVEVGDELLVGEDAVDVVAAPAELPGDEVVDAADGPIVGLVSLGASPTAKGLSAAHTSTVARRISGSEAKSNSLSRTGRSTPTTAA